MPHFIIRRELDVQTHMVNEALELGGHAFKAANRFKKGILDLSVQLPGMQHAYVEIKYKKKFRRNGTVPFDLTRHQRTFILDHNAAGGNAGWCMVVAMENGRYAIDCSRIAPSIDFLEFGDHWFFKERGRPWPMKKIVETMMPWRRDNIGALRDRSEASSTTIPRSSRARIDGRPRPAK